MKVLFVCNQGKHRSKTAELLFNNKFETKSAGIYTNISEESLEWADKIFVMEEHQRKFIGEHFPKQYLKKQIISLDIPDIYSFEQPELIEILNQHQSLN